MQISPTKQNLLILKTELKTFGNGYKLLQEKRNGLILNFLELAKLGSLLEKQISKELEQVLSMYKVVTAFTNVHSLLEALPVTPSTYLKVNKKRVSGVYITDLKISILPPYRPNLKNNIRQTLDGFAVFFPKILQLTELKLNCQKLALEIQKVNRQIANLENRIDLNKSNTKFIQNTLNQTANLEKATLIKLFK